MKYQKLCKTLIRSRFHGMYWCAHKTATLTSIQNTVPPPFWRLHNPLCHNLHTHIWKTNYEGARHIRVPIILSKYSFILFVMQAWWFMQVRSFIWQLWQCGLWSFQTGDTKLKRFLTKNQHTQRKLLNFENWVNGEVSKIWHHFSK